MSRLRRGEHERALRPGFGHRIEDRSILRSVVILQSHNAADYEQAAIGHVGVTRAEQTGRGVVLVLKGICGPSPDLRAPLMV
jgi:hypothetical protein